MNPTTLRDDKRPKVTVGILSWNRLHYLKATLESARTCIDYPDVEWIVVDNESTEPGLLEYLESLSWLDHLVVKRQSHADAMNQIVDMAKGDLVMIWPEDVQFTVRGDWMIDVVDVLENHRDIGSMCLDFMRRSTIEQVFNTSPWKQRKLLWEEVRCFGSKLRRSRMVTSRRGARFRTFGWSKPGICGSGIPSITRKEVWEHLGPWRATSDGPAKGVNVDSSLGAESDMVRRFLQSKRPLQGAIPLVPVAADIITDPLGCKAKVRGGRRYGVYMPPVGNDFYYEIVPMRDMEAPDDGLPIDFTTGVQSIGYTLPLDEHGDRKKFSFNDSVVWDIDREASIAYPLKNDSTRSLSHKNQE